MAGDTLPRLARPDGGVGGVGAAHALCWRCLFRVDPRHGRVAVHTSPWLVRATARGEVGTVFTRERAAFRDRVNPSTDVGAVAVLPRHRSGGGSMQSRGEGAQPSAGDWRGWDTVERAASSLFKSCGERPRAVHQPGGAVETWVRQVILVVAAIPRIACLP